MTPGASPSSSSNMVQWTAPGQPWKNALTQFARTAQPRTELAQGVYLRHDKQTLAIYDGYNKARFHFLVLPRLPFPLNTAQPTQSQATTEPAAATRSSTSLSPPSTSRSNVSEEPNGSVMPSTLSQAGGASDGTSKGDGKAPLLTLAGGRFAFGKAPTRQGQSPTVQAGHLASLSSLMASPYAAEVLAAMRQQAEAVKQLIEEEMRQTPLPTLSDGGHVSLADAPVVGVPWGLRMGFHAVPSMDTLHLHIISDDLVSDRLKHKKHYLSFHPTHGFWLELDYVERLVRQGAKALPHTPKYYDQLLKAPLVSYRNGREYSNMPQLKRHLEEAWIEDLHRRRSQAGETKEARPSKRVVEEVGDSSTEPAEKAARREEGT